MEAQTSDKIAFVTYETPFAPCGGLSAVMGHLPGYMHKAVGLDTVVITPFHHRIARTSSLPVTRVSHVDLSFHDRPITVRILRYDGEWSWYFLRPEDENIFAGARHPYDIPLEQLRRDAMFFGEAVTRMLPVIEPGRRWFLLLQDWEAATTALAFAYQQTNHSLFLTLHNSYDCPAEDAWDQRFPPTIIGRVLASPLVAYPVFTVSEQFAADVIDDPLQAQVIAPHLRQALRYRLRGVNNGPFITLTVPEDVLGKANRGNFEPLHTWKSNNRQKALEALDAVISSDAHTPVWGDRAQLQRDDAPWFVMAGRDDPRQKGYDVATVAVRRFLATGGKARFFFFPIPGDEDLPGLGFLKALADDFPKSVLVFPFRWVEGFLSTLQGAAYGLMPSLYEPFGAANEFYMHGTVGIGRATGGLLQQIVPLRSAASFSPSVQIRADRWHASSTHPTGILYRESDGLASTFDDWAGINAARYNLQGIHPDRVAERTRYRLFQLMADELRLSIADGVRIYQEQPTLYWRMLVEGIAYMQRTFSWERAAHEYARTWGLL